MTEPTAIVTGDAVHGFIVELHDGDRSETYGVIAESADAAHTEGLRRFLDTAPMVAPEDTTG